MGHITIAAVVLTVIVCLPWYRGVQALFPATLLGLDIGYFLALFGIPLILGGVALLHSRQVDDQERHIRKFENE